MKKYLFNLQLFDDAGGVVVADNAANDDSLQEQNSANDTANPVAQGEEEASKPSFDDLINGEYKKDYQKNINKVVRSRLKGAKETEDKLNSYTPLLEMLASRYGMDGDVSKLNAQDFISKMMDDDEQYEDESIAKGIPIETLKSMKKMELENATMKRQLEERALEEQRQREFTEKMQEAEQLKEFYPNFDFTQEIQASNEGDENAQQFMRLLGNGVPMKLAFEVTHPELITNAMKVVAQTASEKVANSVKANSKRPSEGGGGLSGGTPARLNPATMTEKEIRELRERALSGERIVL